MAEIFAARVTLRAVEMIALGNVRALASIDHLERF